MEVRCLQWSLHSQDLNIIELIWDFIDPRLQKDICQKRFFLLENGQHLTTNIHILHFCCSIQRRIKSVLSTCIFLRYFTISNCHAVGTFPQIHFIVFTT